MYEEGLKIAEKRVKGKGEKERYTQLNAAFHWERKKKKQREIRRLSEINSAKKIQENNKMGTARDPFKKIGDIRGHCM